jgi:hypothetical protein
MRDVSMCEEQQAILLTQEEYNALLGDRWISVEDKKLLENSPDRITHVLAFNGTAPEYNQHIFTAIYYKQTGKFIPCHNALNVMGTITHYQSLPQPPKQ